MKKILCFVLVLLILISSVISCKDESEDKPEITTGGETTNAETSETTAETEVPPTIVNYDISKFNGFQPTHLYDKITLQNCIIL